MKHNRVIRNNNLIIRICVTVAVMIMICCMILMTGCTEIGAEAQVKMDLESMRTLELDEQMTQELTDMLDEEGRSNYYEFIKKAGDFNYKILESKETEKGVSEVTVRITSYSFGKAYLEAWSDYLEDNKNKEFDQEEFYETLMEHLSEVDEKEYRSIVTVKCTDPDGEGNWITDPESNYQIRNAILGGMLAEIASLAG